MWVMGPPAHDPSAGSRLRTTGAGKLLLEGCEVQQELLFGYSVASPAQAQWSSSRVLRQEDRKARPELGLEWLN